MAIDLARAGKPVYCLEDICEAREKRQSLYVPGSPCWGTPRPAAFVLQLSGEIIMRLICLGLRLYVPPSRPVRYDRTKGVANGF